MNPALVPLVGVGILLLASDLVTQEPWPAANNPKELGKVAWQRDLDKALARSKRTHKPIFLFFQEVPG